MQYCAILQGKPRRYDLRINQCYNLTSITPIDYLKEGLYTLPLGVWNLGNTIMDKKKVHFSMRR